MLHTVTSGAGPRVVLVHGFTQTLASWRDVAGPLERSSTVVRVDLPGHGGSAALRLGFAEAARAVGDAGGPGTYVGYSMGGRLCLRLALERPDLVTGLVLLGASPGIAQPAPRAERRAADHRLAEAIERDGVDAFLATWLAQPLFATLPPDAAGLDDRRSNTAAGLASSLRLAGVGEQEPLWDRLPELAMPVLLVAGGEDAKFAALAEVMAERIGGNARVALVPGAGHAVHLERAGAVVALIESFLAAHRSTP